MRSMRKLLWLLPLLTLSLWGWHLDAAGITVTFSSPPAGNVFPAGLDYATDVLGDPWDMNSMGDISIDPQQRSSWSTIGVNTSTGVPNAIGGTTLATPGGFAVLYPGLYAVTNTARSGRQFPVDTSLFRKLSFKLRTQIAHSPSIFWFHRPSGHPSGEGIGGGFANFTSTAGVYSVAVIDLASLLSPSGETWALSPTTMGIVIDPRGGGSTSENIFFDWVRLTAPDGAAQAKSQTVNWSGGSGNATVTVTDS